MSHQPHHPTQYACEDCRTVFAGIHDPESDVSREQPPDECAVCGGGRLTELSKLGGL